MRLRSRRGVYGCDGFLRPIWWSINNSAVWESWCSHICLPNLIWSGHDERLVRLVLSDRSRFTVMCGHCEVVWWWCVLWVSFTSFTWVTLGWWCSKSGCWGTNTIRVSWCTVVLWVCLPRRPGHLIIDCRFSLAICDSLPCTCQWLFKFSMIDLSVTLTNRFIRHFAWGVAG